MLIFGPRDPYGLKIAIWLFLIWNGYFFVAVFVGMTWLSLVAIAFAIATTCYSSCLLCKHREGLVFSGKLAKEHGFPSSRRMAQMSFNMHLLPSLTFLVMLFPATLLIPSNPKLGEKIALIYVVYQVCFVGVVGILHHLVRMVVDKKNKQTEELGTSNTIEF